MKTDTKLGIHLTIFIPNHIYQYLSQQSAALTTVPQQFSIFSSEWWSPAFFHLSDV